MEGFNGLSGWVLYYLFWNAIAFLMMGWDKSRARRGKWRIRERTIFGTAFFMGAAGILAGMFVFRHKTQHLKFVIGIPLMLLLNLAISYFFWMR